MTTTTGVLTPEAANQVREIAQEVFQEHQSELLKTLGDEFRPLLAPRPMWPDWVETVLRDLAEAQKRTEERLTRLEVTVQELAEAQKRTEKRVEELAEAQKRTEERLTRLEVTVQELAEAQKRTEEQIAMLVAAQRRTEERLDEMDHRLGLIANVLGVDTEVEAQEVLLYVLEQKNYRVLEPPCALDIDGEVDIAVPVETPEGMRLWVLMEVKARARLKELRRWVQRLESEGFAQRLAERGVTRPYLFYLFGLRVYQVVENEARRLGVGVLDPDGERVASTLIR